MCVCTPGNKIPFCGKMDCVWPFSQSDYPSLMDLLVDDEMPLNPDNTRTWYAVKNTKAVRYQPSALFRLYSDAQRHILKTGRENMIIIPVDIALPAGVEDESMPLPAITVIVSV